MGKGKLKASEESQQVSDNETAVILGELRKTLGHNIDGDIVEFGCYKGDTSLLMEKVLEREFPTSGSRLWIYDSFEGLPDKSQEDASSAGDNFQAGELFVTKREVVERFKRAGLKVPRIRKGFFEDLDAGKIGPDGAVLQSSNDLPDKICFAFLDGDLYQSIKTSLTLVAPRMARDETGKPIGMIIVHDYNNPQLPGSARAVDEWMRQQKTAPRLQRRETLAIISW